MSRFRSSDLWLWPSLISLCRIPLAVVFALFVDRPHVAFGVLALAAASDVLDGWYARRYQQVTVTGAVVDPITDKLFVATVAISLVVTNKLAIWGVVLLSVREIGELPLVVWLGLSARARRSRH